MVRHGELAISIVSYKKCWNEIETGAYSNRHITNDTLIHVATTEKFNITKTADFFRNLLF